jgi:hypothetical protein
VRDTFQGAKVDMLIIVKLATAHVTMVLDDFTNVFRRQVLHDSLIQYTCKFTYQLHAPICLCQRILLCTSHHSGGGWSK